MRAILLMLMLLALPAFGQSWSREATDAEDAWHKLQILVSEDDASVRKQMAAHGLSFQDFAAIRAYVERSQKELAAVVQASAKKVCANRAKIEGDPDLLIKGMEQLHADDAAHTQKIIERLPEAIGAADAMAFSQFVARESRGTTGGLDFTYLVRSGQLDPKKQLDRMCGDGT